MRRWWVIFLLFWCAVCSAAYLPPARSKNGMAVASQYIGTLVGLKILKEGGNAIDAAVAMGYALAVTHPCCGNLGGGGFMIIHMGGGQNYFLDFREVAPFAIKPQDFMTKGKVDPKKVREGYLAVGVPGTVMGLNTAQKKFGRLPLKKVMAPAIRLARNGFTLRPQDARILASKTKAFFKQKNIAAIFMPKGKMLKAGDTLVQSQLAQTLAQISEYGTRAFYDGSIAKTIVDASKANGGVLSLKDFENYRVHFRKPIYCNYRGFDVVTAPPPGSGVTVCEILNIVSGYPLTQYGFHSAKSVHVNVEAMRYAYYDRNYFLGDPAFIKNPIKTLISPSYAAKIRKHIVDGEAGDSLSMKRPSITIKESHDTTNYTVVDRYGDAVDVTYTINGFFGAKVIAGNTGFFLNNELDDFAITAGAKNKFQLVQGLSNIIKPGKRPLSSMSPTLVLKQNHLYMALGAAGGSTIISSIVQVIENVVDFDMQLNAAVNAPRYHFQWLPDKIFYEPHAFSQETQKQLEKMGYTLQQGSPYKTQYWGQVTAVQLDANTGEYLGANDSRYPAGLARGY